MTQNQKRQPATKRYAPLACEECGVTFTPKDWRQKLHPDCALKRQRHHTRKWRQDAGLVVKRRQQPPIFTYRTDFLLALPLMRAELERACQNAEGMRRDFVTPDELELPATGRRRSA